MKFEKVLAERKDKVIYKDGDKCIKVFDENYKKSDNEQMKFEIEI